MPRALVIAARQPEFSSLLEDAGFEVAVRTRPLDGSEVEADVVVYCTGYKVTFPFFDAGLIAAPDNDLATATLCRPFGNIGRPGCWQPSSPARSF